MTHPQTIDTDALRVSVEDGKYTVVIPDSGGLHALRYGEFWQDLTGNNLVYCLAVELSEARGELDRLRAAEAASKARVGELESENSRLQVRLNFEMRLNKSIKQGLSNDSARAEIARLTDAGTELVPGGDVSDYIAPDDVEALLRDHPLPPPPAAADRGVPGQEDDGAFRKYPRLSYDGEGRQQVKVHTEDLLRLLALATAPKAEDVRREAIDAAAKISDQRASECKENADYYKGSDFEHQWRARQLCHEGTAKQVRALAESAQ